MEGPTDAAAANALRARQRRNLLATVLLSQGVPMLLAGDELGNSQRGNNNGYAQDNEISWLDWDDVDQGFLDFCRHLVAFRRDNPALRRGRFLTGLANGKGPSGGDGLPAVAWFTPGGEPRAWHDWGWHARQVVMWLNGDMAESGPRGEVIRGTTLLLAVNAHAEPMHWTLPEASWGATWRVLKAPVASL